MDFSEHYPISDWDNAYANASNIPNGSDWPELWVEPAKAYRKTMLAKEHALLDLKYGEKTRNVVDIFLPDQPPKGLVVFVHGGFWLMLDKSYWSHFAQGCVNAGYAVAMPSYTLCPDASIADICLEVAQAIAYCAEKIAGPIRLTGHSAGGLLVTSMLCSDSPLDKTVQQRIVKTVSISGVHDLRPLLKTSMKEKLGLNEKLAEKQSPVLKQPGHSAPFTCWVGALERPEFLRLNHLQAEIWKGFSIKTNAVEENDRHHFNIIDGLIDSQHPLTLSLLE